MQIVGGQLLQCLPFFFLQPSQAGWDGHTSRALFEGRLFGGTSSDAHGRLVVSAGANAARSGVPARAAWWASGVVDKTTTHQTNQEFALSAERMTIIA